MERDHEHKITEIKVPVPTFDITTSRSVPIATNNACEMKQFNDPRGENLDWDTPVMFATGEVVDTEAPPLA